MENSQEEVTITKVTKIFHIVRRVVSKESPHDHGSPQESYHIHELHARMSYPKTSHPGEGKAKRLEEHFININALYRNVLEAGNYNGLGGLEERMKQELQDYFLLDNNHTFCFKFDQDRNYKLEVGILILRQNNERIYYYFDITAVRRPWGNTLEEITSFHVARAAKSKENIALLEVPSTVKEKLNQFYEVLPPYEHEKAEDNIPLEEEEEDEDEDEDEGDEETENHMVAGLVDALGECVNNGEQDQTSKYDELLEALRVQDFHIDFCKRALNKAFQVVYWTNDIVHKI